jgi:hypothetical protein
VQFGGHPPAAVSCSLLSPSSLSSVSTAANSAEALIKKQKKYHDGSHKNLQKNIERSSHKKRQKRIARSSHQKLQKKIERSSHQKLE